MKKDVRKFKVYEQSGHNYKPTPTITLKGLWLEELGFGAGTLLTVRCEEGKRVLAVDFDSRANRTTCFGVEDTGVLDDQQPGEAE